MHIPSFGDYCGVRVEEPLIELRSLRFTYPGATDETLRGVDFSLAKGERVALSGHNGSGKSTLLKIIVGLLRPSFGAVFAFGRQRRSERDFHEVRERAGLLFQEPDDQLFCATVAEDVAFGPFNLGKSRREVAEIVERSLAQVGLEGFGSRITYKLSGGEKRLASLAAVLAMEPEVLLLDEPSSGLDDLNFKRLKDCLLASGKTMLIVSHDKDFTDGLATAEAGISDGIVRA